MFCIYVRVWTPGSWTWNVTLSGPSTASLLLRPCPWRASKKQKRQGCHCVLGKRGRQALGTLRLECPRAQDISIILACLTLRSPKSWEEIQASLTEPNSGHEACTIESWQETTKESCYNVFSRQCIHSLGQAPCFAVEIRLCVVLPMFWVTACDLLFLRHKQSLRHYLPARVRQLTKPELASSKTSREHQATTPMGPGVIKPTRYDPCK